MNLIRCFSGQDITGITTDGTGNPNYTGYLGTPNGTFLKYQSSVGDVEVLK
jgi:hypothetical protein